MTKPKIIGTNVLKVAVSALPGSGRGKLLKYIKSILQKEGITITEEAENENGYYINILWDGKFYDER